MRWTAWATFPFLFGGTFIEAPCHRAGGREPPPRFPFLFGGTFIEAHSVMGDEPRLIVFPFLFGGTFIEA